MKADHACPRHVSGKGSTLREKLMRRGNSPSQWTIDVARAACPPQMTASIAIGEGVGAIHKMQYLSLS